MAMNEYEKSVRECIAKRPKRTDYDLETSEGIETWQADYAKWQIETIATLLATARTLGLKV